MHISNWPKHLQRLDNYTRGIAFRFSEKLDVRIGGHVTIAYQTFRSDDAPATRDLTPSHSPDLPPVVLDWEAGNPKELSLEQAERKGGEQAAAAAYCRALVVDPNARIDRANA